MNTLKLSASVLSVFLACAATSPGKAQVVITAPARRAVSPQKAPMPPKSASDISLADALAHAKAPADGFALAVDADSVALPDGSTVPRPGTAATQVAQNFGLMTNRFGSVTAIVPKTMVLLNTAPGQPNIYDGMPPQDALKLLAASLSPAQWQALTGESGLGVSELTDQNQHELFMALFPGGKLQVTAKPTSGGLMDAMSADGNAPPDDAKNMRDLSDDLPQMRLRLSRQTDLSLIGGLPGQDGAGAGSVSFISTMMLGRPGAPPHYSIVMSTEDAHDTVYGAQVRDEVPNTLKKSELDYTNAALNVPVSLVGLKTVGELVARVNQASHIELYADKHYEDKSLSLVGVSASAGSAYAKDLLRALALCVTGTWRQVGPAFVLTNDIVGAGTTHQIWADFESDADAERQGPLGEAGDKLSSSHLSDTLQSYDGSLSVTPQEMASSKLPGVVAKNPKEAQATMSMMGAMGMQMAFVSVNDLTPDQKAMAQQLVDSQNKMAQAHPGMGLQPAPDSALKGQAMLMTTPHLDMIDPNLDGPIEMGPQGMMMGSQLFMPSAAKMKDQMKTIQGFETESKQDQAKKSAPSLAQEIASVPRRAIIAAPTSIADVDALIPLLKQIGLNELWLSVYADGTPHLDLLDEALKATQGTGIHVYAVMDVFSGGKDTSPDSADITIRGETSLQANSHPNRLSQYADLISDSVPMLLPKAMLYASPYAPSVQQTLVSFVQDVSKRSSVAGLIWRETAPPGYSSSVSPFGGLVPSLGYTGPARLAFLRQFHADPIDINFAEAGSSTTADLSLPQFDDDGVSSTLATHWNTFRQQTALSFLRALYTAVVPDAPVKAAPTGVSVRLHKKPQPPVAKAALPAPRVWVQTVGSFFGPSHGWYGSWDSPHVPLPVYHSPWEGDSANKQPQPEEAQAKSQSRSALAIIAPPTSLTGPTLAAALRDALQGKPWDGFVLDLTAAAKPIGADTLAHLIDSPAAKGKS